MAVFLKRFRELGKENGFPIGVPHGRFRFQSIIPKEFKKTGRVPPGVLGRRNGKRTPAGNPSGQPVHLD